MRSVWINCIDFVAAYRMDLQHVFQLRGSKSDLIETSSEIFGNPNHSDEKIHIMCILWKGNKLGAAYYSLSDSLVSEKEKKVIFELDYQLIFP